MFNSDMTKGCLLLVGTEDGVHSLFLLPDGKTRVLGAGLQGNAVRALAIHPDQSEVALIGCGLRGEGLYRTEDAGRTFRPVAFSHTWVWEVAFDPRDSETIYVGTEPPRIYASHDGGITFAEFTAIDELPGRALWSFFYEPFKAGHIHGFALHPDRPLRLLAAVEVGGLIASYDGGKTWHESLVGKDLHRVAVDPHQPDTLLAAADDGIYRSEDAGRTWKAATELRGKYFHSVLFDRFMPGRVYVSGSDPEFPLARSDDGGSNWIQMGKELPPAFAADNLAAHPRQEGVLFYGGNTPAQEGRLFVSVDSGHHWHALDWSGPRIWRLRAGVSPSFLT